MNLGLGLYRDSLTEDNFRFARQAGATHVVVHLVDYFKGANPRLSGGSEMEGWGTTTNQGKLWSFEELIDIKKVIETHGLKWEAIENFDPSHWSDILLDGPKKKEQIEGLKCIIRNVGKAGIPIIGYNFSIAGVWGWTKEPIGRGGAVSLLFDEEKIDLNQPMPNGMVWNMVYDPAAPKGSVPKVSSNELWDRLRYFLKEIIPVAEESGVRMAAHPDDPPVDSLRGAARLVNQPHKFQRLLDLVPSYSNGLEFCLGTIQEMREGDIYESLDKYSRQGNICYVHFRNVKGKVPRYKEVFVDEGDIDMIRVLGILKKNNYGGVLIPDHTPEMSCGASWHAGMAFALGYMKGAIQAVQTA
jgi:mannonate dehydratase